MTSNDFSNLHPIGTKLITRSAFRLGFARVAGHAALKDGAQGYVLEYGANQPPTVAVQPTAYVHDTYEEISDSVVSDPIDRHVHSFRWDNYRDMWRCRHCDALQSADNNNTEGSNQRRTPRPPTPSTRRRMAPSAAPVAGVSTATPTWRTSTCTTRLADCR